MSLALVIGLVLYNSHLPRERETPGGRGLIKSLFARFINGNMKSSEGQDTIINQRRGELLHNLSGTVVDLGTGTGTNIPYFVNQTSSIKSLYLVEPNAEMHGYLYDRLALESDEFHDIVHVKDWIGQEMELDDESVDAVVTVHVLCSVTGMVDVLEEIKRVLKPGGRLLFIEHVRAPEGDPDLRWLQDFVEPVWR